MKNIKIIFVFILLFYTILNCLVFETERGKMEILGLKKWTAEQLLDTMKALKPNKPLHACAAEMKYNFGFPEVSSLMYIEDFSDLSSMYTVVTIIDENDEDKIKYLDIPTDSLELLQQYQVCDSLLSQNPMIQFVGPQTYHLYKNRMLDSAKVILSRYKMEIKTIEPFWKFLETKNTISDLNLAMWIINYDSNPSNRKIAISILLNFKEFDSVWWTLMNLQRDKDDRLSGLAINALRTFSEAPHKIDWSPAIIPIKYIINGTKLFAFQNTLEVLTKTKISTNIANKLLDGSYELLLAYLNAEHDKTREVAINFVRQISGDEELDNAKACKKWLKRFI